MTAILRRLLLWDSSIADDRGNARLLDLGGWKHAPAWRDSRTRFALEEARRLARPSDHASMTGELQGVWAVILVFGFIVLIILLVVLGPSGMPEWVVLPAAAGLFYLASRVVARFAVRVHRERIIETLTGAGLCPACAYDLSATEESGEIPSMVVCPECGGAWRASRFHDRRAVHESSESGIGFGRRVSVLYGMRRRTLRDDAGRESFLQVRTPKEALRTMPPSADRERWTRAHHLVRRLGATPRLLIGGGFVLGGAAMVGDWVFHFAPIPSVSGVLDQLIRLFLPLSLIVFGASILNSNMAMNRRESLRILLGSRLCPTCSDDLREGRPASGGCVRCRTCGGRWRPPTAEA